VFYFLPFFCSCDVIFKLFVDFVAFNFMKSKLFNGNYVCVACGGTLVKVSVCVTLSLTEGSKLDKIDRIFLKMNKIVQN